MDSRFLQGYQSSRRRFLSAAGHSSLSAAGISLLAGLNVRGVQASVDEQGVAADIRILNAAIGAEHEAAAASILTDEAMHWAVLRQALGLDPVPGAFFA